MKDTYDLLKAPRLGRLPDPNVNDERDDLLADLHLQEGEGEGDVRLIDWYGEREEEGPDPVLSLH